MEFDFVDQLGIQDASFPLRTCASRNDPFKRGINKSATKSNVKHRCCRA